MRSHVILRNHVLIVMEHKTTVRECDRSNGIAVHSWSEVHTVDWEAVHLEPSHCYTNSTFPVHIPQANLLSFLHLFYCLMVASRSSGIRWKLMFELCLMAYAPNNTSYKIQLLLMPLLPLLVAMLVLLVPVPPLPILPIPKLAIPMWPCQPCQCC